MADRIHPRSAMTDCVQKPRFILGYANVLFRTPYTDTKCASHSKLNYTPAINPTGLKPGVLFQARELYRLSTALSFYQVDKHVNR